MKLSEIVEQTLAGLENAENFDLNGALADAERMADQFAEVRPVPYIIPIERMAGLPYETEKKV